MKTLPESWKIRAVRLSASPGPSRCPVFASTAAHPQPARPEQPVLLGRHEQAHLAPAGVHGRAGPTATRSPTGIHRACARKFLALTHRPACCSSNSAALDIGAIAVSFHCRLMPCSGVTTPAQARSTLVIGSIMVRRRHIVMHWQILLRIPAIASEQTSNCSSLTNAEIHAVYAVIQRKRIRLSGCRNQSSWRRRARQRPVHWKLAAGMKRRDGRSQPATFNERPPSSGPRSATQWRRAPVFWQPGNCALVPKVLNHIVLTPPQTVMQPAHVAAIQIVIFDPLTASGDASGRPCNINGNQWQVLVPANCNVGLPKTEIPLVALFCFGYCKYFSTTRFPRVPASPASR